MAVKSDLSNIRELMAVKSDLSNIRAELQKSLEIEESFLVGRIDQAFNRQNDLRS